MFPLKFYAGSKNIIIFFDDRYRWVTVQKYYNIFQLRQGKDFLIYFLKSIDIL